MKKQSSSIINLVTLFVLLFSQMPAQAALAAPVDVSAVEAKSTVSLETEVAVSVEPAAAPASVYTTVAAPGPEPSREILTASQEKFRAKTLPDGAFIGPFAAPPPTNVSNGDITIEPIAAYNLVVDSNVLSPSSYGPNAATLGAKFCNTSGGDLTNVWANIGDYNAGTPGEYPQLNPTTYSSYSVDYASFGAEFTDLFDYGNTTTTDFGDTSRLYALKHESGRVTAQADASRYLGTLADGECRTQYWVVTYPRKALINGDWVDVTGGIKPNDDLWLPYDFWATTGAGNTDAAHANRYLTMRNEISAMANKIWPNGDNKVPDVYKNAISEVLGWDTITPGGGSLAVYPGEKVITTQGIWYDLGNANQGFDNNEDMVPDYNAWLQPIGDASSFDPGCFRLVRTYGLIIVKQQGGKETLIPFVDQLYFENLPADNTGVVGLAFYEYMALDGVCTAGLTPYQEVASGRDNEKFNADYGAGIPSLQSRALPDGSITKTANPTSGLTVPGGTIAYTITFNNPTTVSLGAPEFGLPLVIQDSIPAGTTYVSGTAAAGNTPPTGVASYAIYYSTDDGDTWSATQPSPASSVTDIQWWLSDPLLPDSDDGVVTFSVAAATSGPIFYNVAGLALGNSLPFATDDAETLASGTLSIGDFVWRDENNDKSQAGETANGINGVTVSLYYDVNNDNELDSGDLWLRDTDTVTNTNPGYYAFTNLPNGEYLVVVDSGDVVSLWPGYRYTTPTTLAVTLSGASVTTADFGFGPTLLLDKILLNNPAFEGRQVNYAINITNLRPGGGTQVGSSCVYELWASNGSTPNPPKDFTSFTNVFGVPDDLLAYGDFAIGANRYLQATGYNAAGLSGTISQVDAIVPAYISASLTDDSVQLQLIHTSTYSTSFSAATLNASYIGPDNLNELSWTIPAADAPGGSWDFSDFASLTLQINPVKSGGSDASTIYVDAMGFRVTMSGTCPVTNPDDTMVTVPLTDTYNTTYLQYQSSNPAYTTLNETTGNISWDNVGPILPGQTKSVTVSFLAKDIGTTAVTFDNTATTTGTRFADGEYANDDDDSASGTMNPTGTITGYVYSDPNSSGWNYNPGAGDLPIPDVTVTLYACISQITGALITTSTAHNSVCTSSQNNGAWVARQVKVTDSSGYYSFAGLLDGFYYVAVSSANLPGTVTQRAEASDTQAITGTLPTTTATGATCGTCDSTWGVPTTAKLGTSEFNPINSPGEIINGVNFGYVINPGVYGTVWEDVNGNGSKSTGEPMIGSVTVRLYDSTCTTEITPQSPTTTNSSGRYQFGNLTNGTTYCIKTVTSTLPGGASAWTETGESDLTVDNTITFTAAAGTLSGSHEFGFQRSGSYSLSGTVYADWNGNSDQDGSGEPGFSGVLVKLYDGNGVFRAQTTTDANGDYSFTGLPAGSYSIVVQRSDVPDDYLQTEDYDSIRDSMTDVTITTGSVSEIDFGYKPYGSASIGDRVWRDLNGDGVQDGGAETGIPGITVWLEVDLNGDDNWTRVAETETTGSNGDYLFSGLSGITGLSNGKYRVVVDATDPDLPNGLGDHPYVPSTPVITSEITLNNGDAYLEADFGFKPPAAMGDTVYWDVNDNGEQDWSDPGIPGATVELVNANSFAITYNGVSYGPGAVIDTATTADGSGDDPAGFYLFTGLPAGDSDTPYAYTVRVTSVSGNPDQTADPDRDGEACDKTDIYPNSGAFACNDETTVGLYPGNNFVGADFGYKPSGAIGDRVWLDINGDGIQDPYEVSLPDVTVTLTGPNCASPCTVPTDIDGYYSFVNLSDGTYTISFARPVGMTSTTNLNAARQNGNGSVGQTTTVVVGSGVVTSIGGESCTNCSLSIDSGFRYNGDNSLSGTICLEPIRPGDGGDGVCGTTGSGVDSTESAYSNILIYLYRLENGQYTQIAATQTDSNGDYSFTYLPDGTYRVGISAPESGLDLNTLTTDLPGTLTKNNDSGGKSISAYQQITVSGSSSVTNMDFAFSDSNKYDYGDLPDTYNTLNSSGGARNIVPSTPDLYLGTAVQTELNGLPTTPADGDGSEEDGVTITVPSGGWKVGANANAISVVVNGTGYLYAWMDFNQNGTFDGEAEFIIQGAAVSNDTSQFDLTIPGDLYGMSNLNLYARFRLVPDQLPTDFTLTLTDLQNGIVPEQPAILSFYGTADNGETEDYRVQLDDVITPVTLAYFHAERRGANTYFDWSTASETGNVGFNLYVEEAGQVSRVNPELIFSAVIDTLEPQDYTFSAKVQGDIFYVEDISIQGKTRRHGPFTLSQSYGERLDVEKSDLKAIASEAKQKADARQAELRKNLKIPSAALKAPANGSWKAQLANTLNLKVNQTGLQRVTYEMLRDAGLDLNNVPLPKITVLNRGQMVPVYMEARGKFGPGSYLEFYGEALDTLYTDTNIYTVQVVQTSADRVKQENANPSPRSQAPAYYMDTLVVNNQRAYLNAPPGNDPWYDTWMWVTTSSLSWDIPFEVTGLASTGLPYLDVAVWGGNSFDDVLPDHRVVVSLNGVQVADQTFDGLVEHLVSATVPADVLHEGKNTLTLTLPGTTGALYDVVYFDRLSLTYPRFFQAENGRLTFTASGDVFTVGNLSGKDVLVYRLDANAPVRLTGAQIQAVDGGYTVTFSGQKEVSTYLVTLASAIYQPAFEAVRSPLGLDSPAEFLIISHPQFIEGLAPLVAARRAEGLTVNVVNVEDLYAQYAYGIFDPQAIKDYIKYAASNLGVQYILLVGGDTYDYRNFTGRGGISFIPSIYVPTHAVAPWTPSDPFFADVNGDDLPDLAIGRFPVRTEAELNAMVQKTLAYGSKTYNRTAVFASDAYDPAGVSFKEITLGLASRLPSDWTVEGIHLDDLSLTKARQDLLAAMNRGTAVVTYTGHSHPARWSFSSLFTTANASSLKNTGRPFLAVQWGCWNVYHYDPTQIFMVQTLLFAEDRGAAAVLGSTSWATSESQQKLGDLFTPRLAQPGMRLGEALQQSKTELARTHPELLDVLLGWTLMGDPTLVIVP